MSNQESEWFDPEAPDPEDGHDPEAPADEIRCPSCHRDFYEEAERCPHCGTWVSSEGRSASGWWLVLVVLVLVAFIAQYVR